MPRWSHTICSRTGGQSEGVVTVVNAEAILVAMGSFNITHPKIQRYSSKELNNCSDVINDVKTIKIIHGIPQQGFQSNNN